uniref:Reverse transcriptase domain-containing protein n=1 Tax=Tanacetum cinerariifolium TaxID=118510 RepID=A0A6L2K0C9_TANCI|nr:hypothetical protein [Tanacetum cinerariifolium]
MSDRRGDSKVKMTERKTDPIRLDFEEEDTEARDHRIVKGKEVVNDKLKKPFKEALRMPLTRGIIEFSGLEYKMPTNIKLYDARGWFVRLPANNIIAWSDIREAFAARYLVRRACFREPHEITKIVRKVNESLTAFKERVSEAFLGQGPNDCDEIMRRLDDFVRSKKDFAQTELPKGETGEQHRKSYFPSAGKEDRPYRNNYMGDTQKNDNRNHNRGRDNYVPYKGRDNRAP